MVVLLLNNVSGSCSHSTKMAKNLLLAELRATSLTEVSAPSTLDGNTCHVLPSSAALLTTVTTPCRQWLRIDYTRTMTANGYAPLNSLNLLHTSSMLQQYMESHQSFVCLTDSVA
jgi:hypothetical protein